MNDAERATLEDKIHGYVLKWKDILPLGLWSFREEYQDTPLEGLDAGALGEVDADWAYLFATIHWYVPGFYGQSEGKIEQYVLHELVHCLVDRLTHYARSTDEKISMGDVEQDTQLLTFGFLWAYNHGWNEAKDSLHPDVYDQIAQSVAA